MNHKTIFAYPIAETIWSSISQIGLSIDDGTHSASIALPKVARQHPTTIRSHNASSLNETEPSNR
jgi:hypothetical protein